MTTYNRKQIMQNAWCIARDAVVKFGGKAREYLALALKEIWSNIKNGVKKMTSQEILDAFKNALKLTKDVKVQTLDNVMYINIGQSSRELRICNGTVDLKLKNEIKKIPEVINMENMLNKIANWIWTAQQKGAEKMDCNLDFANYDITRDAVITDNYIAIPVVNFFRAKWVVYGQYQGGKYHPDLKARHVDTDDLPEEKVIKNENKVTFSYIFDVDGISKQKLSKLQQDFKNFWSNRPVYNPAKKHFEVEATEEELLKIQDENFKIYADQPNVKTFIKFI